MIQKHFYELALLQSWPNVAIIGVANIKHSTHVRNKNVHFQERSPYMEILP